MSDDRPIDIDPSEPAPSEPGADLERVAGPGVEPDPPRPRRGDRRPQSRGSRPVRQAREPRATSVPVRSPRPTSASAARRRLISAFIVLAIIIAGLAFAVWTTLYRVTAGVPAGRKVAITVPKGATGEDVATLLAEAGIVGNPNMFRVRASLLEATGKLKAGAYTLTTGSDYDDVIAVLSHGPEIEYTTVTIPEGYDIPRTAARIEEKLGISAEEFTELATKGAKQFDFAFLADNPTRTLEGYLFPKTYDFKKGVKAADVIRVMLAQYAKEISVLDYSYSESKGLSPHDVLTIASIIEREAQLAKDRPKVASVIYNRLAIDMLLQLDSTVQYALDGKAKLTLDDLKVDDRYNTYRYKGVPPGPICSPGISAISAAAKPAKTDYLYYILTHKDGSQSFATNYADFLRLKAQYKRGLK